MSEQKIQIGTSVESSLAPGDLFETSYQIEGVIGDGATSMVYRALQLSMQRQVAIKVLKQSADEKQLERFKQEARALSLLDSPHILKVYATGITSSGRPYIVSELIEGEDLSKLLLDKKHLPVLQFCSVFRQLSTGLAAAHDAGIVHRDIKPGNIMVSISDTGDYQVRLVDFGLAKDLHLEYQTLTGTGALPGTPAYMSPEQCQGKKADSRSDVYSLGIVMYESISACKPFQAESAMELFYKQSTEIPASISKISPSLAVPNCIEKMIFRCLEKDPANRIQTAGEILAEIRSIEEDADGLTHLSSAKPFLERKKLIASVLAVCLVATVGIVTFVSRKQGQEALENKKKTSITPHLFALLEKVDALKQKDIGLFEKQLEEATRHYRSSPTVDPNQLAYAYEHLGLVAVDKRNLDKAKKEFEKCLSLRRKTIGQNDEYYQMLVSSYIPYLELSDQTFLEAEKQAHEAVTFFLSKKSRFDMTLRALQCLGEIYDAQGRFDKSLALKKSAIAGCERRKYLDVQTTCVPYFYAASECYYLGRRVEGLNYCNSYWRVIQPMGANEVCSGGLNLAGMLFDFRDSKQLQVVLDGVEKRMNDTAYSSRRQFVSDKPRLDCLRAYLAFLDKKPEEAVRLCSSALGALSSMGIVQRIQCTENLADLYALMGDSKSALKGYELLVKAFQEAGRPTSGFMRVYHKAGKLCVKEGRTKEARDYLEKGLLACPKWYKGNESKEIQVELKQLQAGKD